ncbi:MAG: DUF2357 domain-containing protein [Clostridiales bacterium]|nr:DUF2357 domain-containing protein [Clostridiales bacterium]
MDKSFLDNFITKINGDGESYARFFAALRGGENKVLHNVVSQAVMLDDGWILTIEGALHSIEQIVRNPRKFIAENELILDVSKVRRTNSKTVRHLTTHSQFVQNIDDEGEVTPKKLLTFEMEEDIAIYENRFICALVNRLIQFVEQRFRELDGKMRDFEQTNVCIQSEFDYGKSKFKCNLNLQVEEPPENEKDANRNKELFERVGVIRRRLRVLQATDFMKKLSKAKPVRPPIQKTNLLTKNVDYNNCYKLWLYISSYTYLGYSIEVKDKNLPVDGDYFDDLTVVTGLSLQSLLSDRILKKEKYDEIEFSEPEEREYTLVTNYEFTPDFTASKQQSGEETINEYYFRRMKDELTASAKEGEFEVENRLNVNFTKFFRSVSRINDEMYNELIEEQIKDASSERQPVTAVEKKRAAIKDQQERVRRRKLFLKLKWEEVERAQRMSERAESKLARLQKELEEEKKKATPKRVTRKKLTTIKRTRGKGE